MNVVIAMIMFGSTSVVTADSDIQNKACSDRNIRKALNCDTFYVAQLFRGLCTVIQRKRLLYSP